MMDLLKYLKKSTNMKSTQIFGLRAIIEAIEAGKAVDKVFLQKGLRGALFTELETLLRKEGISSSYVPVERLNRFTQKNHQGAIAQISPVDFHDLDALTISIFEKGETPLFIILDQVTDVRNFGAIIRTAACTGVHGIIISKQGSAPINGDTVKTSAGGVFTVPICKVDHIKDAIYYLQSSGIEVFAASEKTDNTIFDVNLDKPVAVIMGSEGKGVSSGILKIVDHKAKLPMQGSISSLNVSVACGAILYEIVRQRS